MSELDRYDVEQMIRDERYRIESAFERRANQIERELRNELEALRQLVESLERTLQSRTEHLV